MRPNGFTLIEILAIVGIVAILSGAAVITINHTRESTRVSKLESDVATINAAIDVYTINGGSLPSSATPQEILAQLKTRADTTTAPTIAGLRGSMVDLRLTAEMQTSSEAAGNQTRALWNGAAKRFVIVSSGAAGVKNFLLDDTLATAAQATEARAPALKTGQDEWVWSYTDVVPSTPGGPSSGPATGTAPAGSLLAAPTPQQLNPPVFSPAGGSLPLINFDVALTLTNPNPPGTSQIFYSVNGAGVSLYTGQPLAIVPGTSVSAYAVTSDPDHWTSSIVATNNYQSIPVNLSISLNVPVANLTYAEAGGAMTSGDPQTPAPVTVTLNSASQIPSQYLNSSKFQIYYTLDGTSPLSSGTMGPLFSGTYVTPLINVAPENWNGSSSLVISAVGRALDASMFVTSPVITASIGITPMSLVAPTIDPPSGLKAIDLPVSIAFANGATYPVGARIYYTTDGSDPGNTAGNPTSGTLYTGQFNAGAGTDGVVVVTARVYGPAGYGHWFTPSNTAVVTYTNITLPNGALVGNATLNGTFVGSIVYAAPSSGSMNNITFNSNAKVLGGNLYLPGTPTIRLSNGTTWSLANDSLFASHIQGWEYTSQGVKTSQTTPRVLDETGSVTPNNYNVTFNSSSLVEGKVVRRHTAPEFPTISPPPAPDSSGSTSLNSAPAGSINASQYSTVTLNSSAVGAVSLDPGHFANLTANNGTSFVLGDPQNPEVTQVYSFQNLTLNSSSDLQIVGKVIVTVGGSITLNSGSVLGNPDHPEWLQLQFSSGNLTANSDSSAYGQVVVPTGSVTFNSGSIFRGSVTAQTLTINSNSVVFELPPVIQN